MWDWVGKLAELKAAGSAAVVVTVVGGAGSLPRDPGAKMVVVPGAGEGDASLFFGTIGGGHLEQLALEEARRILNDGGLSAAAGEPHDRPSALDMTRALARVVRYPLGAKAGQCCGGVAELLFELINAGPRLYLFGVGHVGQAVCRTLAGTPFRVHAIDDRSEWIDSPELPAGVTRHRCEWDAFVEEAPFTAEDTYVVIMTHRHDVDQEIVAAVVRRPARYLGLIGSHGKWQRFTQRLSARGFTPNELARVRCPIGLPTGGKAPQEVAISLAAELLSIHYGRV